MPAGPSKPRKPAWWGAVVAIVIALGIAGIFAVAFPDQFKHQLEISVVRQPTPYTQLFFTDQEALPKKLSPGHVNEFSFTVSNDEGHAKTYHYTITMTAGKTRKVAGEGVLTLEDKQSASRTVGVKPPTRGTKYLIEVSLAGTPDLIHFSGKTTK